MRILALALTLALSSTAAVAYPAPGCKVTLEQFSKINLRGGIGSLYTTAGCHGTVISQTSMSGFNSRTEQWEGDVVGSLMHVTITNGFITNKVQIGLK